MIHIIPGLFAFDFKTTTTTKKKTPREENKSISMYYCWKTYVTFILAMQKVFEQEHHEHESLIECLLGVWSVDIERFYLPFSNNRFILALLHIYNVIGLSTKEFLAIKKNEVKRSKRSGSRKESRERKKNRHRSEHVRKSQKRGRLYRMLLLLVDFNIDVFMSNTHNK